VVGRFDRLRLRQALGHLVDNALKFGAGKPVQLCVERAGDGATITIVDHGGGVTEDEQTRMFDRFERAASADHHGGFGVGLWVARHVVEAQRGTITVRETPGGGVTLIVTLPLS
jgi:signal transduction histidine kinase